MSESGEYAEGIGTDPLLDEIAVVSKKLDRGELVSSEGVVSKLASALHEQIESAQPTLDLINPDAHFSLQRVILEKGENVTFATYILTSNGEINTDDFSAVVVTVNSGEAPVRIQTIRREYHPLSPLDDIPYTHQSKVSAQPDLRQEVHLLKRIEQIYKEGIQIDPQAVTVIRGDGIDGLEEFPFSSTLPVSTEQQLQKQYEQIQIEREKQVDRERQPEITAAVERFFGAYLSDLPGTVEEFSAHTAILDSLATICAYRDEHFMVPELTQVPEGSVSDQKLDLHLRDWVLRRVRRAVDDYVRDQSDSENRLPSIEAKMVYDLLDAQQRLADSRKEALQAKKSIEKRQPDEVLRSDADVAEEMEKRGLKKLEIWTGEAPKREAGWTRDDEELLYYTVGQANDEGFPSNYLAVFRKKGEEPQFDVYGSGDGHIFVHGRGDTIRSFKNRGIHTVEITGLGVETIHLDEGNLLLDDTEAGGVSVKGRGNVDIRRSSIQRFLSGPEHSMPEITLSNSDIVSAYFRGASITADDVWVNHMHLSYGNPFEMTGDIDQLELMPDWSVDQYYARIAHINGKVGTVKPAHGMMRKGIYLGKGIAFTVSEEVGEVDPFISTIISKGKPILKETA